MFITRHMMGVLRDEEDKDGPHLSGDDHEEGLLVGLGKFIGDDSQDDDGGDDGADPADKADGNDLDSLEAVLPRHFEDEDVPEKKDAKDGGDAGDDEDGYDPDLPVIGAVKKDEVEDKPVFDADSFDAETNAILKKIEDAGHPGDVYKGLRAELKKYKSGEVASETYQKQLEELQKTNKELAEKAAQVDAVNERMQGIVQRNAELALQEDPEYQSKVISPYNEIKRTVAAISETKGIEEAEIWAAIKEPNIAKRMQMVDALEERGLSGRYALAIESMSKQREDVIEADRRMRSSAVAIAEQRKNAELAQQAGMTEEQVRAFQQAAKASFERYASKIPGFTDGSGNMTDLAKSAQARSVTVDPGTLGSGDLGYMVFSTNALPEALREIKRLEAENRDLRVAAGKSGKTISGGSRKKAPKDKDDVDADGKPLSLMEHFAKNFG